MNSQWFSVVTLMAALLIGYLVINQSDDVTSDARNQSIVVGYYLKDAIVTETAPTGDARMRFAANEIAQGENDSVTLSAVRVDYLAPADKESRQGAGDPAAANKPTATRSTENGPSENRPTENRPTENRHWVVNADQAILPANPRRPDKSGKPEGEVGRLIKLRGNVVAYSIDAEHAASLRAPSLDIDTERQTAQTDERARVELDGRVVEGNGLFADLKQSHVQLRSQVTMRLAAAPQSVPKPGGTPQLSLPELFSAEVFETEDNVLVLTKVRSLSPPFISADKARGAGKDLANNQWLLTGSVRVELPQQGQLLADQAVITVSDSRVIRAQVTGNPVNFEHRLKESEPPVHGRARRIDYNVPAQTVEFSGDAWFNNGKFEFKSESIEYNLATGAARGTKGSGGPTQKNDDAPDATVPAIRRANQ
ncbi:MAG TPA: LPS export ABC transporter periplasmic protein LptC [Steroidobacteraceae bacterium]|nr:LPS export ABC transporter periplasmic protein LptC [Steroidobacteraceae bacterium]